MKQVLHIFRKDTRHFWPEILISLVLLALYAIHYPSEWRVYSEIGRQHMLEQIATALGFFTPVSWWLLIARVTYGESLVGDNEFWLTRPYVRKNLLAAKTMFLAVWICLPYLLFQAWVFIEASLHPLSYIPGLLANLFLASAVLLLPLFAIATFNKSFARMTLTLLGMLFLFITFMFFISTTAILRVGNPVTNPYEDVIAIPLVFCICAAAIIVQYQTRRVWVARSLLMVSPVLVLAVVYAYSQPSFIDRAYSRPGSVSTPPVQVAFTANAEHPIKARVSNGEPHVNLPIRYSGVPEGYLVYSDDVKFTLVAANGQQWNSGWLGLNNRILPGIDDAKLTFSMPVGEYRRFQSMPVTLRATFALTRMQAGAVTTMNYPSSETSIPGLGICIPNFEPGPSLTCRSVGWQHHLAHITTLQSNTPCIDAPPANENTALADIWNDYYTSQFESAISPIRTQFIYFNNRQAPERYDGSTPRWHQCPGTPLTITPYAIVDRTQSELVIPDFHLPPMPSKN